MDKAVINRSNGALGGAHFVFRPPLFVLLISICVATTQLFEEKRWKGSLVLFNFYTGFENINIMCKIIVVIINDVKGVGADTV